jgi:DNA mismatch repair ATPase MutS
MAEGTGLRHPVLQAAVPNDVAIAVDEPVMFLTGPNMAGKTTYLRSVGLAVLLGQLGMGVPAQRFRLAPAEVLLSSLNPTDNLQAGISYYYAEVLRVKQAAAHAAAGRKCLVIFDEIFKGTNVKDALEASEVVISRFARSRRGGAIFASHLVELAEPLAATGQVALKCFEGSMSGGRPRFSYELKPGASSQRFGLALLDEAGVPELLDQIDQPRPAP